MRETKGTLDALKQIGHTIEQRFNMRIASDGRWFHEGKLIRRTKLVQLFSTILRLEEDGYYYLVSPIEKLRIRVEDCPFIVDRMDVEMKDGNQTIVLRTSVSEVIEVSKKHPIKIGKGGQGAPHPVIHVRDGLVALINRPVFYRLAELLETVSGEIGVSSCGKFLRFEGSE